LKRSKRIMSLLMVLLLMVPVAARAGDLGDGSAGVPGTWYIGSQPSWVDPAKAPIVFVHGYNSSASVWWDGNDMYETALANGYQTAFIDLYPERDMWENGAMLAGKLKQIYEYFGNKKVVVVGHSKGGIDTQTALVHYGAHQYVTNVITLSSPHHGTQLSDLAHSSSAWWLAALLGNNNDATRSLQTGNMSYFRSVTDSHANSAKNRYYTLGGYKWGSFGSALYWGGLYLSSYGSNDGVVTVSSSRLPGGMIVREGAWNHTTIREGSYTFSVFKPYTMSEQNAASTAFSTAQSVAEPMKNQIVKGGKAEKTLKESFVIEDGAESFQMAFLSERKLGSLKLKGPDGREHKAAKIEQDTGDFFKGAWVHTFDIDKPQAGEWNVTGPAAAYLLVVSIESPFDMELKQDKNKSVKASYKTNWIKYERDGTKKLKEAGKGSKAGKVLDGDFTEPGVYNLTTEVTGVDATGNPFERTIIESIYVDENGKTHR
jgi:pimeloyl-ACP methyl ester carboxylesterase